jgi:hypothetical protein
MAAAAIPILIGISAAAAIGGTVVQSVGAAQEGKAAAKQARAQAEAEAQQLEQAAEVERLRSAEAARALEANARIAEQQAQQARDLALAERRRAGIEAEVSAREARRRQGSRVSQIAASGGTLSGSGLDALADAVLSDTQQQLFIIHDGEQKARAHLAGADIEQMSAAEFQRQAAAERDVGRVEAGGLLQRAGAARRVGRQEAARFQQAGAFGMGTTLLSGFGSTGLRLADSPTFRRAAGI